jgi:hypothetical protein
MAGTQQRTDDGVIGTSGKKIRVFDILLRSSGGGASTISIYNGTSASGTLMDVMTTSGASVTLHRPFGNVGMQFPNGCFIDVDGNTAFVNVNYEQENA